MPESPDNDSMRMDFRSIALNAYEGEDIGCAGSLSVHLSSPSLPDGDPSAEIDDAGHTRENLNYGQESARDLSNQQIPAGAGEEQLINDVPRLCARLVMMEKEYIDKDLSESCAPLDNQKWQALVALCRTLHQKLHYPELGSLFEKDATLQPEWHYGILSCVELLPDCLPEVLEHRLPFYEHAYLGVTLLLETVPAFQDTWLECLGHLSRYRMAVEESDPKERQEWAGIARDWYNKAAHRNPDFGRIQHHLAVVSSPDILLQLFHYTKSLVTVRSFAGSRESILLLFNQVLQSPELSSTSHHRLIPAFVAAHGALFKRDVSPQFFSSVNEFLPALDKFITYSGPKFRIQGVHIASCNFAAMLEYSHSDALLLGEFQQGTMQSQKSLQDIYASAAEIWTPSSDPEKVVSDFIALGEPQNPSRFVYNASFLAFESMSVFLDQMRDPSRYSFPALHISLSFVWCLSQTPTGIKYAEAVVPWRKLVTCLNTMFCPWVKATYVERTDYPHFKDCLWTPEDYYVRGQIWSQSYYPQHYFDNAPSEEDERNIEQPSWQVFRTYKCLWLGVRLAKFNRWITYDPKASEFSVTPFADELEQHVQLHNPFITKQGDGTPRPDLQTLGS